MSAEDIKFPPSERREVRQFEVPPWEQDQFDRLRQEQAAREAAERAAAEQAAAAEAVAAQAAAEKVEQGADGMSDGASVGEQPEAGALEPVRSKSTEWVVEPAEVAWEAPAAAKVDDAEVDAMLAQLAMQEETPTGSIAVVSLVSAILLVLIGCVLIVWAMAGFVVARRAGLVGTFGGTVLLLFGAGFVAGGIWIWMRSLRQRGVL